MENAVPYPSEQRLSLSQLLRSLGPGIMMAAAAVGGSHLVASTKAGAIYGWQLAVLILLVNLFKYPFFKAGVQYTMGTGDSLVEGYAKMGKPYLWIFTVLAVFSGIVNTAALLMFSASLLSYFIPFELSMPVLCGIVLATCLIILFAGHYRALDTLSKVIMAVLTIATLLAVVIAAANPAPVTVTTEGPSPWTLAAIGFLVVTMGWMPAPIEISSLTSVWLKSQCRQQRVTAQSALFDFNVGYIGTAILAIVFLALGALVLHGTGVELSKSGVGFSHQLVGLYASTIGEWSRYLIAVIAFFCIFGSTITVIDGYSRVIAESQRLLKEQREQSPKVLQGWMILVSAASLAIIVFFASALMPMLNFAMIMAFMTTPVFALLNYVLVTRTELPDELKVGPKLKALSILGLIYLFGFLALFIWWKWLM
ncbi:Nramp family divalent metal transporter [Vibrio fluvialis]|uniref:Nramp family divalent metal transporter n=1 Tax=Vibrio fluvialis TaxID=676 RepID=UPI00192B8184|nr:Nramp family divalent metal transporter [Vibrio fluvialis]MBL4237603.1 Nramp family divalent metal transporter [Vibrio fluvialis]MBL4265294.1 Nramp family divalent metal transporter [Vibrio fluvialis]MBL4269820.1 Nramp family divalent metal transporter [Vibrio fluvialis]MBL4274148.1 Nramp family divalent metal transporter [Vibrio fluvialis]MBL4287004.1 Nramp family divalent metal transporter [Vibrio fluvialis]